MNRFAFVALSALAVCGVANAKPEDWYSPAGSKTVKNIGNVICDGFEPFCVGIADDGTLSPTEATKEAFDDFEKNAPMGKAILGAFCLALQSLNEIETLAESINANVITKISHDASSGKLNWYTGLANGNGEKDNQKPGGSVVIKHYDGDDSSVEKSSDNKFSVKGWETATPGTRYTLADVLDGGYGSTRDEHIITRSSNGTLNYVKIGNLGGSASVDNASTKTNAEGKIEVYGFSGASRGAIPYRDATSLAWLAKSESGYILTSRASGLAWSGTAGGSMYYGTDINGGLGWNMLPNVTTNAVETDNRTLKAEGRPGDPSKKIISIYTAPGANGLYGAYMEDNHLAWSLITIPTNFPTIVDNKSVNSNNTGAVQLYNWENLGNGVLCKNGDHPAITNVISKVTATNGVENIGGANDRVGLAGWTAPQCSTSLAAMLTSNATDRATHRVLCRRETANGVEMHYASIGKLGGIGGGALKFVGNYDATAVVVGSGDTTNTVTFAALDEDENPSVKVKVEADGANGVILKLGAFYK